MAFFLQQILDFVSLYSTYINHNHFLFNRTNLMVIKKLMKSTVCQVGWVRLRLDWQASSPWIRLPWRYNDIFLRPFGFTFKISKDYLMDKQDLSPKVGNGVFTARNEVGARLCFYTRLLFCSQGGVCPIACWDTHPPGTRGRSPPRAGTPPAQCMLGDTGNKRAIRILLECNLVQIIFSKNRNVHSRMESLNKNIVPQWVYRGCSCKSSEVIQTR